MDFAIPDKNIKQFGLSEGMKVADLGSGSGHYTLAAARMVGTSGEVHAVEVQRELLQRFKEEIEDEGFRNITVTWGDIEEEGGTKLRDNSMDAVILSNILFQVEDKEGTIREARRILKPGGRVLVIDWTESFGGMGPEEGAVVKEENARRLFESLGFAFGSTIDAGAPHYGFIMKKT